MVQQLTDNEIVAVRRMLGEMASSELEYVGDAISLDYPNFAEDAFRQYLLTADDFSSALTAMRKITRFFGIENMLDILNMKIPLPIRTKLDALPWNTFFAQLDYYVTGFEAEEGRTDPLTFGELCRSLGHALGFLMRGTNAGAIRPEGSLISALHVIVTLQGLAYNFAGLNGCTRVPRFQQVEDSTSHGGPYPWSVAGGQ